MVDPRIYRAGLALVAVALIVFGFSLQDPPGADQTSLAAPPTALASPYTAMSTLAKSFPDRRAGSAGDARLAQAVAAAFHLTKAFDVSTQNVIADTSGGQRTLQLVTASRIGLTSGAIVVIAHRDAESSGDPAAISGTAVLVGLAHDLAGETQHHTIMLVSTSGAVGAAGASALADSLAGQPVDAVIALGDLARARASQPLISPWSSAELLAPPVLTQTLGSYVTAQTGLQIGSASLGGQIAHLAFPLATTEQAPFAARGIPAVLLSLSGTHDPNAGEVTSAGHINGLENAVLQTINALDGSPAVPPPAAYLTISGKIVPLWAVRLLVLALIVPVALATIDALARTRRRGHSTIRWLAWVLAGAVPFFVAWLAVLGLGALGAVPATPPSPVAGGVGVTLGEVVVGAVAVILLLVSFFALRPLCIRIAAGLVPRGGRPPSTPAGDAAAVSLLVVTLLVAVALWALNPFAAALVVPALHLWMWLAQPAVRARRTVTIPLAVLGLAPGLLVAVYYGHSLGVGPLGLAHTLLLAVAGRALPLATSALWCVLLGCAAGALVIALRSAGERRTAAEAPVTVRGPVTYAGPGSLGGTESALGPRR